ncbi:hypothetical protein OOZ15_03475 [Galbibacter sp. EGI 63066]|uniref:hypothetical protein n=1 Tax=Galbibacter sp. EGI 63066 TaxID=2993559 RepID=UPI002248E546|nr:hypothetical protein [Galbibacter sp. EGI 63066]MCX2678991.1 hypothetical protein [Galbibacter sp. EGI 63066]
MSSGFTFINNSWFWPVIIGAVVLLLVFVWKEWQDKGNFFLKTGLAFLAVASLVLIILQPATYREQKQKYGVLLTKNYHERQLDSLKKAHRGIELVHYDADMGFQDIRHFSKVFVLGNGVKPYHLSRFNNIPLVHLSGTTPKGIVKLNYDREAAVGDVLSVKGLYSQPLHGNRLVLQSPGGTALDSIILTEGENQTFQLKTTLSVQGEFLYDLVEKDSLNTVISKNSVPVIVRKKSVLKVLMFNSFPTFESKYLKNFLSDMGHELVVRSRVSKGRYKYEYFNTNRRAVSRFNPKTLQDFDLVIIDASSLRALYKKDRDGLENAIRNDGLGVFVQTGNNFKLPAPFSIDVVRDGNTEVHPDAFPKTVLTKKPYVFNAVFAQEAIHTANKHIISAYKQLGNGRIGTTTLENTFEIILSGKNALYKKLWTQIIEKTAKKKLKKSEWDSNQPFAYLDEPFAFTLRTSIENPEVINSENSNIPLASTIDNPNLWKGVTHPKSTGWQRQFIKRDSLNPYSYYVMKDNHWQALNQFTTITANKQYSAMQTSEITALKTKYPLSLFWFYLIFVLSVGYLWLVPKLG